MFLQTATNTTSLTYDKATEILQHPLILTVFGFVWIFPIILYLFVGLTKRGYSSSGKVASELMIFSKNFAIPLLIWGLFQLALFLLALFPFWLRIFE